jgi:hypothetical protein
VKAFNSLTEYAATLTSITRTWHAVARALAAAREKYERLIAFGNDSVATASVNRANQNLARLDSRMLETKKEWQRLWQCMTVDRAPWSIVGKEKTVMHWKRERVLCNGIIPMRVTHCGGSSEGRRKGFLKQSSSQILRMQSNQMKIFRLSTNSDLFSDFPVEIVKWSKVHTGMFSIRNDLIHLRRDDGWSRDFRFEQLKQLLHRTRFNRPSAIEIFLISGRIIFVDFPQQNSLDILGRISTVCPMTVQVQKTPFIEFFATTTFTQDWLKSRISNFRYLSLLNLFSGRSFNDSSQYPLFPWIITDYTSGKLNPADQSIYRNFSSFPTSHQPLVTSDLVYRCLSTFRPSSFPTDSMTSISDEFRRATESDGTELIPEFFAIPEIFSDQVSLPPWAESSPMQFVYLHRKALESPTVTENLHHWIDFVWGCDDNSLPHRLFANRHPHRVCHSWVRAPFDHPIVCQLPAVSIVYGSIRYKELFLYEVEYIETEGNIVNVTVNLMNVENLREVAPRRSSADIIDDGMTFQSRISIPNFSEFGAPLQCTSLGNLVAVIDCHKPSVALIDVTTGSRTDLRFHHSSVISVYQDAGWLVTAGCDAIVNVFSPTDRTFPLFSIPLYRDEITCCAISAEFNLIASGTRDGFLILSSLERGSHVHVIDLNGKRPSAVLITGAWGFVIVTATKLEAGNLEHSISVYSVNGIFIRQMVIQDAAISWTTWSSATGFDFLAFATGQGKLYSCEVFFLDFQSIKSPKLNGQVVNLRYHPRELGLLVLCSNAELLLVPFVTK